jgi:hypothetical protein
MPLRISKRAHPKLFMALEVVAKSWGLLKPGSEHQKTYLQEYFDGPDQLRYMVLPAETSLRQLTPEQFEVVCTGNVTGEVGEVLEIIVGRRSLYLPIALVLLASFFKQPGISTDPQQIEQGMGPTDPEPFFLTEQMESILRHALGAGDRYPKSQWGFRNYYVAAEGSVDVPLLLDLEREGLMRRMIPFTNQYRFAVTADGCKALGLSRAATKRAINP